MLAKMSSKNQLTLPKSVTSAVGPINSRTRWPKLEALSLIRCANSN